MLGLKEAHGDETRDEQGHQAAADAEEERERAHVELAEGGGGGCGRGVGGGPRPLVRVASLLRERLQR